jgi:hypothetical protein
LVNMSTTPFKNSIPGHDYFVRLKRDYHLNQKKPQCAEMARKRSVDPFVVSKYFKTVDTELRHSTKSDL